MALSRYSDSVSSNPHRLENIETNNNYDIVEQVNVAIDPEFYASRETTGCRGAGDPAITVGRMKEQVSAGVMAIAGGSR